MESSEELNPQSVPPVVEEKNTDDMYWLPTGTVIWQSEGIGIPISRLAAVIMRLANQNPEMKVEYWVKLKG